MDQTIEELKVLKKDGLGLGSDAVQIVISTAMKKLQEPTRYMRDFHPLTFKRLNQMMDQ